MSNRVVEARPFVYGTGGTSTTVAAGATNTSNKYRLPRDDFTVSVSVFGTLITTTASTTASSTNAATVVVQGSNDGVGWFGLSSASATGTLMSTSTAEVLALGGTAAAGVAISGQRYGYARAIVSVVGTGNAIAHLGQ